MNNSNRYNPIPDPAATALLHSIGLLLQQAGMYGMGHNVAQLALQELSRDWRRRSPCTVRSNSP